jgi:hypothetical protein
LHGFRTVTRFSLRHPADADAALQTTNDDIQLRILEIKTETANRSMAATVARRVGERNHRLDEWQAGWDELREAIDTILAERGAEMGGDQELFLTRDARRLVLSEISGARLLKRITD